MSLLFKAPKYLEVDFDFRGQLWGYNNVTI